MRERPGVSDRHEVPQVPELDTLMRKGFLASWGCLHLRAGQLCDVLRHLCDLFLAE
jgi:hypothetical protein